LVEDGADVETVSLEKLSAKKVSAVAGNRIGSLSSESSEITLVTNQGTLKQSGTKIELGKWLVDAIYKIMSKG
jgi:hypothetical protein